jgi:sigma-B regulation protein RsbU (phosphoserine phosphatase)
MSAPIDLTRCRVLLVDDVKSNLDALVEALRGHHQLSIALDGESALKSIAHSPPDLVLLDLLMPRLDGYAVCRRLRADPATHDLPVIMLSSLGEPKSKARAFEAGGTDYLTKPFETIELRARVRALLKAKVEHDTVNALRAGELRMAREIQMGMVPTDFSALCAGLPIEIHALLEPATEVGGDLYDVFPLGEGRLCIVIGDVSGKGIPAALFMTRATTLLHAIAQHVTQPAQILSHVNDELSRNNPTSTFVTLFCAILDARSGQLAWASGGHLPPVLVRAGEPPRLLFNDLGTVVGIQPRLTFPSSEIQLVPGDALFLCTDGVLEAFGPDERCFGEERLLEALTHAPVRAEAIVSRVLESVRTFARGRAQSDDIALLCVRWLGSDSLALGLRSTAADVTRGYRAVQQFLGDHGADAGAVHDVGLAVEEVLSNLLRHGYPEGEGPIYLRAAISREAITIELRDRGIYFDPRSATPPLLDAPLDERAPGHLGIHLLRSSIDRIAYQREGDENVLTLIRDRNHHTPME